MPIAVIKPKWREWISKDGTSIAEAKSWTSATDGTSLVVPSSWESGSEQYDHYWAVKLAAGVEYSISSANGEMSTLKLLAEDGTQLATQSMDNEEWTVIPGTYTPAQDMVAYIYLSTYDGDTITFTPRPADCETEHWGEYRNADGVEGAPLASPVRHQSSDAAGCAAFAIPTSAPLLFAYTSRNLTKADTGQELQASGGLSLKTDETGRRYTDFNNGAIAVQGLSAALPDNHPFTILVTFRSYRIQHPGNKIIEWPGFLEVCQNSGGTVYLGLSGNGFSVYNANIALAADDFEWHTLAASYSDRLCCMYLDGELREKSIRTSDPTAPNGPLLINDSYTWSESFIGQIASIYIYGTAMPRMMLESEFQAMTKHGMNATEYARAMVAAAFRKAMDSAAESRRRAAALAGNYATAEQYVKISIPRLTFHFKRHTCSGTTNWGTTYANLRINSATAADSSRLAAYGYDGLVQTSGLTQIAFEAMHSISCNGASPAWPLFVGDPFSSPSPALVRKREYRNGRYVVSETLNPENVISPLSSHVTKWKVCTFSLVFTGSYQDPENSYNYLTYTRTVTGTAPMLAPGVNTCYLLKAFINYMTEMCVHVRCEWDSTLGTYVLKSSDGAALAVAEAGKLPYGDCAWTVVQQSQVAYGSLDNGGYTYLLTSFHVNDVNFDETPDSLPEDAVPVIPRPY